MPNGSINPRTGQCADKRHGHYAETHTNLGKQRAGTGSRDGPAATEQQTTNNLPLLKLLGRNINRLPIGSFYLKSFDDLNGNQPDEHSRADNAVHMERVEAEHFLNSEPGDYFGFHEHNSENNAYQTKPPIICPF